MKIAFPLLAFAALLCPQMPQAAPTPYAGQEQRDIKALAPDEVEAYLSGGGMGYARAAELNSYPGPMHLLELKDQLELSADVQARLNGLLQSHKAEARALGAQVVAAERELDALYKERRAEPGLVRELTGKIGELQARYRASHLNTHITATAMLTPAQIGQYNMLRGYSGGAAPSHHMHHPQ